MTRRVLYVSAFIPDEHAPHAGGQAAFQNLVDLQREGFEVTLLVCTTERPLNGQMMSEGVFRQNPVRLMMGWMYALARGFGFGWAAWPLLDTRANIAFERRLRSELRRDDYALVFADFTQALLPVRRASKNLPCRPQLRACAHDLYVQKLLRDPGRTSRVLLGAVARIERILLRSVDDLVTLSAKDAALATMLYDCRDVTVKAFVPPRWVAGVCRRSEEIAPREVLFFANFDRPENAEALAWFASNVLPQVARHFEDFCLVIAGAGSDRVPVDVNPSIVRRLGFLDDPGPAFSRCRLAIAPLAQGAGVKFKVLEALACQVPVLATSVALEGVPPGPLVHVATRADFSAQLTRLLAE